MYFWHALPTNWESMEYQEFLEVRRYKIAEVIRTAYDKLVHDNTQNNQVQEMDIESIINSAESTKVEFKSTLRVNLFTNKEDSAIENACLKTIAAFLNSAGGRLIIGVDDSGKALGLEVDKFGSEDKQYNHLANLIRERIGAENSMYIDAQFVDFQEKRVFMITCYPAYRQVYVRNGEVEHFYVRTGNSTSELTGTKAEDYILKRFRR
jgi:predicted HTH transcriptional regulator